MAKFGTYFNENTEEEPTTTVEPTITLEPVEVEKTIKAQKNFKALDSLLDENFYNTAKSYYAWAEDDKAFSTMSHEDILEKFYNDRAWGNNNTLGMGEDLLNIKNADSKRIKEFALIQSTYDALPSFWNDPNRSFGSWLIDNGGAMLADPVNLVGGIIGKTAAKEAYKQTLKQVLKNKIGKQVNNEMLEAVAKQANKKALGAAVTKGAIREGQIGAGAAVLHDTLLQQTRMEAGMQDEFSFKRSAISGAAGFGFGTVFGGLFTAGSFKYNLKSNKNTSIKQLEDLHNYGRDEISGRRLFDDLTIKKNNPSLYKNLTDDEINVIARQSTPLVGKNVKEQIKNMKKASGKGKPSDEILNYNKFEDIDVAKFINFRANELANEKVINTDVVSMEQMRADAAALQANITGEDLMVLAKSKAKEDKQLYALVVAHGDLLARVGDEFIHINRKILENPNLPKKQMDLLKKERAFNEQVMDDVIPVQKQLNTNIARALTAGRIDKDKQRAAELIVKPENVKLKKLKEGDPEEYYKAIDKLTDNNHVILSLQHAAKVNKWDLAAEYVNNNLLSSPDTHILNIISGLTQTQWKPLVMLLKAGNMGLRRQQGAAKTAREALETYVYTITSLKTALQHSIKALRAGRPLLDSQQMKVDNNIRQGQLQSFINHIGETFVEPLPFVGKAIQKGIWQPASFAVTTPLRVLSAGDELLKQMMFRGRMTAQINSRIFEGTNNTKQLMNKLDVFSNKDAYKKRFKELEAEYINEHGNAIQDPAMLKNLDQLNNSPLHYAREGTYTQPASSYNPETREMEGGITGAILSMTNTHKWMRVAGLHFINTPSNLLRFTMQHTPLIGRLQLQMRHMLKKGKDGKYLNPEAAMEAQARLNAGWLLWGTAAFAAITGKVTSGGSTDYRKNNQKEDTTGEQTYSLVNEDGEVINFNRLDPLYMPFAIAADLVAAFDRWEQGEDGMPYKVQQQWQEVALGAVASLWRNMSSKFYTQHMLETVDTIFGGKMLSRDPREVLPKEAAKIAAKFVPASGMLRYADRTGDPYQREIITLSDRLTRLNPFDNNNNPSFMGKDLPPVMPRRNMFGEKVYKKNGWLFGLGGEDGIISSPFAQTKLSDRAVATFLRERDFFGYVAPNKKDRKTGLDYRDYRDDKGQTAYDYMLEQKLEAEFTYKGKKLKLINYIEAVVKDKNNPMYKYLPNELNSQGKDLRQDFILKIVKHAEKFAEYKMHEKFPIFMETYRNDLKYDENLFNKHQEEFRRDSQKFQNDGNKDNKKQQEFLDSLLN